MTTLEQNQEIFQALNDLKATGQVVIEMVNTMSTSHGTGSLEGALQKQVTIETVHNLPATEEGQDGDQGAEMISEEPTIVVPTKRVKIQIIGLDNQDTIIRKIEIARDRIDFINNEEAMEQAKLTSDNIFEFLESNFRAVSNS